MTIDLSPRLKTQADLWHPPKKRFVRKPTIEPGTEFTTGARGQLALASRRSERKPIRSTYQGNDSRREQAMRNRSARERIVGWIEGDE